MVKKLIITLILILILSMSVPAQSVHDMNGHDWMTYTHNEKVNMVLGIMLGLSTSMEILMDMDAPTDLILKFTFGSSMTIRNLVLELDHTYREGGVDRDIPLRWVLQVLLEIEQENF